MVRLYFLRDISDVENDVNARDLIHLNYNIDNRPLEAWRFHDQ